MRFIGMDIHRDFCEVAIREEGKVHSAGRLTTTGEQLELFAQSLAPDDVVALEATSGAGLIADLLEGHVGRVGARREDPGIASRVRTAMSRTHVVA